MISQEPAPTAPYGPIKLVAIDLDGTLLWSNKHISDANAQAIADLTQRGVRVVLASARPPRGVRDIYQRLSLDTLQVNYNGALIHDMPNDKHVFHQPMTLELATQIIYFARAMDPDIIVNVEVLDQWHTDRVDDAFPTETSKLYPPDHLGPLDSFLNQPVTKLMLAAEPERLAPVHHAIKEKFADQIMFAINDDYMIQIAHKQVDKANALQFVAEHYNVPQEHVMAIGDASNDLGMVRWAGLGVAMANGGDQLRQAADVIAPANDDDGVAHVLKQYILDRP
jgi:5-amino-6-(5-phospho-D-ribitylamino)uracil phosphatase